MWWNDLMLYFHLSSSFLTNGKSCDNFSTFRLTFRVTAVRTYTPCFHFVSLWPFQFSSRNNSLQTCVASVLCFSLHHQGWWASTSQRLRCSSPTSCPSLRAPPSSWNVLHLESESHCVPLHRSHDSQLVVYCTDLSCMLMCGDKQLAL